MNQLELIEKWHDRKDSEKSIDDFCNEENILLSRDEKIELLSNLAEKDILLYSILLKNSIPLIADVDNVFLEFLEKIEHITHGDLTRGWFEMALIAIGMNNHDLGIKLAIKMKNSTTLFDLFTVTLEGVGSSDYSKIEEIVNNLLSSGDPKEIVNGLRTIRMVFHKKQLENNLDIFSKIDIVLKNNNEAINLESTNILLKFYDSDPNFCQTRLLQLAKSNVKSKNRILDHLCEQPIKNSTDAIILIQECNTVENPNTQFIVFCALENYTKTNYKEIMEIIRASLENGAPLLGSLEKLIRELGKNALLPSLDEFKNWLTTDNPCLRSSIAKFITILIPSEQRQSCFSYFEKWSNDKSIPQEIFLEIYKSVLFTCYKNNSDRDL